MTEALVTSSKDAWVGSGAANATHFSPPRLRVKTGAAQAFVHLKSPVPAGDTVVQAKLRVKVAAAATGTFNLTAKRAAARVTWSELTWNNKPGVTGSSATVSVTNPTAGQVLEFDVTAQLAAIVAGDPNYGWRIDSDSATLLKLSGADSGDGATLYVLWSSKPATPTDLAPAGIVSLAAPYVQFTAPDLTGDDELDALQVQIATTSNPAADAAGTWTSPTFDSGTVASTVAQLDLSGTAYAGMADGATVYWHARWRNTAGVWSSWSDTVSMTRTAKAAVTITNPPSSPATVLEPTPPYIATFAGTPKAFRVRIVLDSDPTEEIADSGWQPTSSSPISWTHPEKHRLQDGVTYRLHFDVRDNVARVASPGDPRYIRATRVFTVDDEPGVTAPVAVSVDTASSGLPLAQVTFTRTSAPDSFVIKRDGETVESNIDPADVLVSGTTYAWVDPDSDPYESHDYQVRAVVNGQRSPVSNTVSGMAKPTGLWLISRDRTKWITLAGLGIDNWGAEDQVGTFTVHGRSELVQIRAALGALGGSFEGELTKYGAKTIKAQSEDLRAMRKADKPVTLVCADYSKRVRLRNVTNAPSSSTMPNRRARRVSFSFIESED